MTIAQKETARWQSDRFEAKEIHGGKSRCNHITGTQKSLSPASYMRRLGELYCASKAAAKSGLSRGIEPIWVLDGITVYTLCSRRGIDALDAWAVALDAHRAAVAEAAR